MESSRVRYLPGAWEELSTAQKLNAWANERQPWDKDSVTHATALLKQAAFELQASEQKLKICTELLKQAQEEFKMMIGKEDRKKGGKKGGKGGE